MPSLTRAIAVAIVAIVVVTSSDGAGGPRMRDWLPPGESGIGSRVSSPFLRLEMPAHSGHAVTTRAPTPVVAGAVSAHGAVLAPVTPDAWGPVITLRTADGGYASPVHANLLSDGRVMLVGLQKPDPNTMMELGGTKPAAFVLSPPALGASMPAQLTVSLIRQPLDANEYKSGEWSVNDDLVCMGQVLTATGALFTAGGTRTVTNSKTGQRYTYGLNYSTMFDRNTWTRVAANMQATASLPEAARWYPTVTRLPDKRLLVTSGFDVVEPTQSVNVSAEIYDPATARWTIASAFRQTPFDIVSSDYTHQFVLPSLVGAYDVLMFGEPGVPVLMSARNSPAGWSIRSAQPRPGSTAFQAERGANGGAWVSANAPDHGASSVMLPIRAKDGEWGYGNGTVLIAGGALGTTHAQAIDLYDARTGQWGTTIDTGVDRNDASTVLLPDGRVLLINGKSAEADVRRAAYVDPTKDFAYSLGSSDSGEVRGYHSVALLLPDGRVLVGGGRDITTASSPEKPSLRYYYPHYMFAPRPRIVSAPSVVGYGATGSVAVSGAAPAEAVLVSLGSMTHSFDSGQRSVQLAVTSTASGNGGYVATITGPSSAQVAPPGHYMLFVLDAQRTPSVATIVQLR